MCNFRNQILSEPIYPTPTIQMTITKTPPFRLPTDNFLPFKDKTRAQSGLVQRMRGSTFRDSRQEHPHMHHLPRRQGFCRWKHPNHSFENVSAEIEKWWPDAQTDPIDINARGLCRSLRKAGEMPTFRSTSSTDFASKSTSTPKKVE
jgi:hypothetical protein